MDDASTTFHSPPGWPQMPDGFVPGHAWQKPEHWGAAPVGWTFYTRNGQVVAPPADAWHPRPHDYATSPSPAPGPLPVPAPALTAAPAAATPTAQVLHTSTPTSAAHQKGATPEGAGRVGTPAGGRRRLLVPLTAAAVVLVVLAVVAVYLLRAHAATAAQEPLTHAQLLAALNPGKDTTVAGVALTEIDELAPADVFQGYGCQDEVAPLFLGADGTAVESRDGGSGVDPATGKIAGVGVTVDAALLTSTGEAQATYASAAPAAADCFTQRVEATAGPAGDTYRSSVGGGMTFIFLTHRNVVAMIRFATAVDASQVSASVEDVDELLDKAQ